MNEWERRDTESLPREYRPISAWGYFGYELLFSIPIIGFICMIIFALSSENINRCNFARSFFCIFVVIGVVVIIVLGFMGLGALATGGSQNYYYR